MIIKYKSDTGAEVDMSTVVQKVDWSGSRIQVARVLEFSYVQDGRDALIPVHSLDCGQTIYGYDEDGQLQFQGNIYSVERNTESSTVSVRCYDNLFILCKSKTTKKFVNVLAEDVVKGVCAELGVKVGNVPVTDKKLSYIAAEKTGYQIIMMAYTQLSKSNGKKYQMIMNGDSLDVIEKGSLIESFEASQYVNTNNSTYRESIENMINSVRITDEQGNLVGYQQNTDDIKKYSMIQDVYKTNPKVNTQEAVKALLKGPERTGVLELLGDYAVKASYSIKISDSIANLTGQFWVKSDHHSFIDGVHTMKVELEFENLMDEQNPDKDKNEKGGS